ncbi:phospholipase D-like domain-containing protein [Breoghania sp.]|uniref:phospholipase D-like domain-containing protein n=1 Tax=Breoghania sp. TaxID=2065378 RepID=UPI002635E454|nr:phospholipase D-like domain-containing protein [Breoghania sp.]MDJ0929719.1 phospholipase D-like domain-containing protein [Breoghania sp.]
MPLRPDNWVIGLATECFAELMTAQGVRTYFYREGVLHQKIVLVDDDLASVGTVNFDNRSFHINFEITLWLTEPKMTSFIHRIAGRRLRPQHGTEAQGLHHASSLAQVGAPLCTALCPPAVNHRATLRLFPYPAPMF